MDTLLLSADSETTTGWDIGLDSSGNIAKATGKLAIAQDVATSCRTWRGEMWYDTTQGVPYQLLLNERPPLQFVKTVMIREGLRVPQVVAIQAFLAGPGQARLLGGQLQITDSLGTVISLVASTNFAGDLPWFVQASTPDGWTP